MIYDLKFLPTALKDWEKLDFAIRQQFKKKLAERLAHPQVPSAQLRGFRNHYKIKLRSLGYRLVYEVCQREIVVLVIAVGKREKNWIYQKVRDRQ